MNINAVKAVFLYEYLLLKSCPERLMFTFFWPIMNLLIWGYTAFFLNQNNISNFGILLISAVILWSLISSSQFEISSPFLEKISRFQLRNFLISSMNITDYILAITLVGLFKTILSFILLFLIALSLFSFNIFQFGWPLLFLIFNLYFFGWILGLFLSSFMIFFGIRISFLNAPLAGLIMPFSCVFYSREVLSPFLKFFSWFLPPSYIFENLRSFIFNQKFDLKEIIISFGLNLLFFVIALLLFKFMFNLSLKKGRLAKV